MKIFFGTVYVKVNLFFIVSAKLHVFVIFAISTSSISLIFCILYFLDSACLEKDVVILGTGFIGQLK